MKLFTGKCPKCGSIEWKSAGKDKNVINLAIQCLKCGTIRERYSQPMENLQ